MNFFNYVNSLFNFNDFLDWNVSLYNDINVFVNIDFSVHVLISLIDHIDFDFLSYSLSDWFSDSSLMDFVYIYVFGDRLVNSLMNDFLSNIFHNVSMNDFDVFELLNFNDLVHVLNVFLIEVFNFFNVFVSSVWFVDSSFNNFINKLSVFDNCFLDLKFFSSWSSNSSFDGSLNFLNNFDILVYNDFYILVHDSFSWYFNNSFSNDFLMNNDFFFLMNDFFYFSFDDSFNWFLDDSFVNDFFFNVILDWFLDDHFIRYFNDSFSNHWLFNDNFKFLINNAGNKVRIVFFNTNITFVLHIMSWGSVLWGSSGIFCDLLISSLINDSFCSSYISDI